MTRSQAIEAELAQLEASRDAAARAAAAELERKAKIEAEREHAALEQVEEVDSLRRSLARDLGIDPEAVPVALGLKRAATTGGTGRLIAPLERLWHGLGHSHLSQPNVHVARESRHVLAKMGLLPPVRAGDKAFGTEAQVRALPAPSLDAGTIATDATACAVVGSRYHALAGAFGLSPPRLLPPACETVQAASKRLGPPRLTLGMAARMTGQAAPSSNAINWPGDSMKVVRAKGRAAGDARDVAADDIAADEMRRRELDLVRERYDLARVARREEHHAALLAQRTSIVDAIDRALRDLPLGEGWWWARQLRRIAANEPTCHRISDSGEVFDIAIDHIAQLARVGGARFTINKD